MILLENVTKDFKSQKKYPGLAGSIKGLFSREYIVKRAVNNISLKIEKGEMVAYIGSNGAGKSTTIKIMSGIIVPSSGTCTVSGIVPYEKRQENAKNIGVVFGQRTQLWWDLPLSETFSVLKEIYEVPEDEFRKRMEFLDEALGVGEFMHSTVRTLSLGQRMRADLMASMLHNPDVLYLDEPTIGLDVVVKEKIREAIKKINAEFQTTVILTTHDMVDIEELCNRIIIIDAGAKIYDGTLTMLKDTYGYRKTVSIEIKNPESMSENNIKEIFPFTEGNLEAYMENNILRVSFDKNQLTTSDVMQAALKKIEITDVTIQETDITQIIKQIYQGGV